MPRVRLEQTIPVFERAKTVHALERAANVIGQEQILYLIVAITSGIFYSTQEYRLYVNSFLVDRKHKERNVPEVHTLGVPKVHIPNFRFLYSLVFELMC
jgi:hypothetical protein